MMTRQSLIFLSFCLAGVLVYVLAGILPLQNAVRESSEAVARLQETREIQKLALPLYADLKKRLAAPVSERLPFPKPENLRREEIKKLNFALTNLARMNNLGTTLIEPDMSALIKGESTVAVVMELTGGLNDFRNYLVAVKALPYVGGLEDMQIRQTSRGLLYRIRIRIGIG